MKWLFALFGCACAAQIIPIGIRLPARARMHADLIDSLVTTRQNAREENAASGARKLYHCIPVNTEFDWLEIQVATTGALVDYYVAIESNMTFSGKPKAFHLRDVLATGERPLLKQLGDRLRIVTLEWHVGRGRPWTNNDGWQAEDATRRACLFGVPEARGGDLLMLSDVDEVPKHDALARILRNVFVSRTYGLECTAYYYNYQWRIAPFGMPVLFRLDSLSNGARDITARFRKAQTVLRNACYHCSYCFGPYMENATAYVAQKLASFSHTEFSGALFRDPLRIKNAILKGIDLFHGHRSVEPLTRVDPLLNAPSIVLAADSKYAYLLGKYS